MLIAIEPVTNSGYKEQLCNYRQELDTHMQKAITPLILTALIVLLAACDNAPPPPANPDQRSFEDIVSKSTLHEGVIDMYQDNESGELFMRLSQEQLELEYLYFATFLDGNSATDTQRGVFASERVIRLQRQFRKLMFLQENTHFYFDPGSALSRAEQANIAPTVLAAAAVMDEHPDGDIMVNVTPVFLKESFQQIKPAVDPKVEPGTAFALGELSEDKTSILGLSNYPENLDIVVNYVYEDPAPIVGASASVTDDRNVGVVLQHTFIVAPENDYQQRFEDPRVGYFTNRVTDMTSNSATPFRDPINRWNLVKKEPGAALSEPVEPIVFWLENTTPEEHRETIRDAVLTWNQAFESAGFRNAVVVNIQPDDAEWDANDLRYNVLRWTSSEESPWGGYGPRWAHPRTGLTIE